MKNSRLLALTALLFASLAATYAAEQPSKPNIIFFLVDDLGYMDIGANNPKTFYETPFIDKIAKAGMRFTDGYAACPVCSPTRASIMTGKYPQRVGIPNIFNFRGDARHLSTDEVTIAKALRDAGYTNFFSGKWHLGDGKFNPTAYGFQPGLLGRAYAYYPPNTGPVPASKDDPKTTDRIANEAVRFIEKNGDKPFFAYLSFQAVHIGLAARADLVAKYKKKLIAAPPVPATASTTPDPNPLGTQHKVQDNAVYAGMIEQLDSAIGRVMDAVDRKGLTDRTIIIFMSDNGGVSRGKASTTNLPLRAGKAWLYEGGIREPFIIKAPGVTKPGSVCSTPVISNDFYPTLLELAGLPLMPKQHVDGISLVPLLKGQTLARGPIYWEYLFGGKHRGGPPADAVRDGDWKLIELTGSHKCELYNLANDIGECHNLATRNPEKAKDLSAKLVAWRKNVGGGAPPPGKGNDTAP